MIEFVGVSKAYGSRRAVQELTFRVDPGEVLGFLGPNGAGKTTTMRLVAGYTAPTSGRVQVAGVDALADPVRLKARVGYLPEHPPIYGEMQAADYLMFVAEMRRVPRHRRRRHVEAVMEAAGVAGVGRRPAGRLSRGYRQRLALAAALVGAPPVLVLDEPTSGLDPQQIVEIRRLIRSLAGRHTILLSSHVLSEVTATCGRVLILDRGRLIAQDTPENLARTLPGSRLVVMQVRGRRDDVLAALAEVDGVKLVELRPEGDELPGPHASRPDGMSRFRVTVGLVDAGAEGGPSGGSGDSLAPVAAGHDPREEIAFALARRGVALSELRTMQATLEDVFLQLVGRP